MLYDNYIGELINNNTPPTTNEIKKVESTDTLEQARKDWKNLWPTDDDI
jgi:hypothetical protein